MHQNFFFHALICLYFVYLSCINSATSNYASVSERKPFWSVFSNLLGFSSLRRANTSVNSLKDTYDFTSPAHAKHLLRNFFKDFFLFKSDTIFSCMSEPGRRYFLERIIPQQRRLRKQFINLGMNVTVHRKKLVRVWSNLRTAEYFISEYVIYSLQKEAWSFPFVNLVADIINKRKYKDVFKKLYDSRVSYLVNAVKEPRNMKELSETITAIRKLEWQADFFEWALKIGEKGERFEFGNWRSWLGKLVNELQYDERKILKDFFWKEHYKKENLSVFKREVGIASLWRWRFWFGESSSTASPVGIPKEAIRVCISFSNMFPKVIVS